MLFRVYLGYDPSGTRYERAEIPKQSPKIGNLVAGPVGQRHIARLIDDEGNDILPVLYSPTLVRASGEYMELGGVTAESRPQSWILRSPPIEATKEWAAAMDKGTGGPRMDGSAAHFHTGSPDLKKQTR